MVQMEILDRLALRIGLYPAVLLMKVRAWTRTNEKNGKPQKDGRCWMYNSISAWHEQIPYMSEKQIRTAIKYLRDNGYLLAEKAQKHKWNQTLHYALSDLALAVFQEIEAHNKPVPMNTAHSSDESAPQGTPLCPDSEVDLPSRANDTNSLPKSFPCNEVIPPSPFPESSACSEVIPRDTFRERLEAWNITETEMQDFLQRTGRTACWAYHWLETMAEDIRQGHVEEYRSPIGALMKRHKENWPLPRSFKSIDLPEIKELQKATENTRRRMMEEYASIQLNPDSPFFKIHKKYKAPIAP